MKKIFFSSLAFLLVLSASAQYRHQCLTDYMYEQRVKENPTLPLQEQAFTEYVKKFVQEQKLTQNKKHATFFIPIVFHVFHTNGPENISREQIMDQVRILNEDFQRLNADTINTREAFLDIAADPALEFRLAMKDPEGECTDGIVRIYDTRTSNGNNSLKAASMWPSDRYLNIWVVQRIQDFDNNPNTEVLGYAQFPWDNNVNTDGIVLRSDYVGSIGTSNSFRAGRVATHEIGHWLGLWHTFQGGCNGNGDQVSDTPPVRRSNSGCPTAANSCSNDSPNMLDMIENYMDYTSGNCQNSFTQGQVDRINANLNFYTRRANLFSAANLIATGIREEPDASIKTAPFFEGAESANFISNEGWSVYTASDNGWQQTNTAANTGSGSVFIDNFSNTTFNRKEELVTPPIDLSSFPFPTLSFKVAYTQKISQNNDSLKVLVSPNCGHKWDVKFAKAGADLATVPPVQNEPFVPQSANDWQEYVININEYGVYDNVKIMFQFTPRAGNNLYIDDINITTVSSIGEQAFKDQLGLKVYPNPFDQNATLKYNLNTATDIKVTITDLLGREVAELFNGNQTQGEHRLFIQKDEWELQAGFYTVHFTTPDYTVSQKVILQD